MSYIFDNSSIKHYKSQPLLYKFERVLQEESSSLTKMILEENY